MSKKAGILIVNGGKDPKEGRWLKICVDKVQEHTEWPNYHLYVWNNNVQDFRISQILQSLANHTLVDADPAETLSHPHAVPLQRLYEIARQDGCDYIVTMDSDAHPIRKGWLTEMIGALSEQTVISAVWRDELSKGIRPYAHPSCFCTSVDFIEKHHLRLDFIAPRSEKVKHDTMTSFTDKALELGLHIHKLRRSNGNEVHRLMSGIYGDMVYHHGAGTRIIVQFHDEEVYRTQLLLEENQKIRDLANSLIFRHYDRYISWLKGRATDSVSLSSAKFFFILGMHRSGTSCLTGSLERCGLYLGEVSRANEFNPKGNHELGEIMNLHDEIFATNGGSWSSPPKRISVSPEQKQAMKEIVTKLALLYPCGFKDPRTLLLMDTWLKVVGSKGAQIIGTFRNPVSVARSLAKRNNMFEKDVYRLWLRYNNELVKLHKLYQFPLIEFDLSDVKTYYETIVSLAINLDLYPLLAELRNFIDKSLDNYKNIKYPIPEICQDTYKYLQENSYKPDSSNHSFQALIFELLEIRDRQSKIDKYQVINNTISNKGSKSLRHYLCSGLQAVKCFPSKIKLWRLKARGKVSAE